MRLGQSGNNPSTHAKHVKRRKSAVLITELPQILPSFQTLSYHERDYHWQQVTFTLLELLLPAMIVQPSVSKMMTIRRSLYLISTMLHLSILIQCLSTVSVMTTVIPSKKSTKEDSSPTSVSTLSKLGVYFVRDLNLKDIFFY